MRSCFAFDRVWIGVALFSGGLCLCVGCANVGCKYDCRKYPTPIVAPPPTHAHIWNPETCDKNDGFERMLPPGYQTQPPLNRDVPKPMPVGPAKAELSPPTWNDPLRGGVPGTPTAYQP